LFLVPGFEAPEPGTGNRELSLNLFLIPLPIYLASNVGKMEQIKILIVEDAMIIAADISMTLSQHNYDVIGIAPRGETALEIVKENAPDLVLMDISLLLIGQKPSNLMPFWASPLIRWI
jgi:hypothetical protein